LLAVVFLIGLQMFPVGLRAMSLDGIARVDGDTRMLQVDAAHLEAFDRGTFESGLRYAKTRGRTRTYELYMAQATFWPNGVRIESDQRRYQTHDTFSAGFGWGRDWLTATGGARVEYKEGRDTFAKCTVIAKGKYRATSASARIEGLHNGSNGRIDAILSGKLQSGKKYLAGQVQRIRSVNTYGLSFGYVLF